MVQKPSKKFRNLHSFITKSAKWLKLEMSHMWCQFIFAESFYVHLPSVCSLSGLNGKMYASLFLLKLGKLLCRIHNFLLNFFLFTFPFSGKRQEREQGGIFQCCQMFVLSETFTSWNVCECNSLIWSSFWILKFFDVWSKELATLIFFL